MREFIVKVVEGKLVPLQLNQVKLLNKILKNAEDNNKNIKVTIQDIEKPINSNQEKLYRAYIINASKHFGNSYNEMQEMLVRFHPIDIDTGKYKQLNQLKRSELNSFIEQANALLSEYGFKF